MCRQAYGPDHGQSRFRQVGINVGAIARSAAAIVLSRVH